MAKITGKTYPHRNFLRTVAKWNSVGMYWTVPDHATDHIDAIRRLDGVTVTLDSDKPGAPVPPPVERKPTPPATTVGSTTIYGDDTTYLNAFSRKNPTTFAGFSSWSTMIDFIETLTNPGGRRGRAWERDPSFFGSRDMDAAIHLARNGWAAGVDKAKEALAILEADQAVTRQRLYSVAGGRVNVGKMLSGSPLHMSRRARQPGKKVITLFVELFMSASVSVDDAAARAASIAAMSDLLELSGYTTEIIGVQTSTERSDRTGLSYHVAVKLKAAGDPLNINDLVFAVGHASMLRRFCFAICALNPATHAMCYAYGFSDPAFNDAHPTASNEFYIGSLIYGMKVVGASFIDRVRSIFKHVVPANFPVTLK